MTGAGLAEDLCARIEVAAAARLDARDGDERIAWVRSLARDERALLAASTPADAPVGIDDVLAVDVRFRAAEAAERTGVLLAPRHFAQSVIDADGGVREGFAERAAVASDRRDPAGELAAFFVAAWSSSDACACPIERVVPAQAFAEVAAAAGISVDEAAMRANASSGFAARRIRDTGRWSRHAVGAIDLNPAFNPQVVLTPAGEAAGVDLRAVGEAEVDAGLAEVAPAGSAAWASVAAHARPAHPYVIGERSPIVRHLEGAGWSWGGRWSSLLDWQHLSPGRE